jgi:hypothetical protein
MKKLLVIMLMLVYGFSTTGMTLQLHYCCGKLKSVELAPVKDPGCGNQHKMGSKPCCETKNINSKSKADQDTYQLVYKISNPSTPVIFLTHSTDLLVTSSESKDVFRGYTSPPIHSRALFLMNRVFRI